ncbi:hypothetical protein [Cytobacillus gottheilii]|uniref:Uncharacterized protein n=1 Tax=Cytobacillus gottheilii TaxID=859144 RepID=A0ABX8F9D3_9BACI|nr:hypothetical protein [Cytobacillus gottheilii]QVY60946.1 hypothetical protein J1899_18540 [Cytobacillus gottheilii]
MKLLLVVFRLVLIGFNLLLINFHPSTELEVKIFFASRLVFFLMLLIDYTHVAYYNIGLERIIGVCGFIISLVFSIIDGLGYFGFLILEKVQKGYILSGNPDNFLTSFISSFNAGIYVFISLLLVMIVIGVEVVNQGVRHAPSLVQNREKAA